MNCRWRVQQLNMFLKDMLGLTIFFSRQVPEAFQYGHLALRQEILCVSEQKGDSMILGILAVTSTLEKEKDERAYCSVIKDPLFFMSWSCNQMNRTPKHNIQIIFFQNHHITVTTRNILYTFFCSWRF